MRRPGWQQARRDLRTAHFLLRVREERDVSRHVAAAGREVAAAIAEMDRAAVVDRTDDYPRGDAGASSWVRLRRVGELLGRARAGLASEERKGDVYAWRDQVYRHIDRALNHVHRASVESDRER
jgi:hypothetical protein